MTNRNTTRFTRDGSDALEAHLESTCARVLTGVRALVPPGKLVGIMLGGGYGRGEGGVLRTRQVDLPYNDLEFYVFTRGNSILAERKYRQPLHHLGEQLSPEAGLEVEFKVLTLGKLRDSGPAMFYYDLVMGHRWLEGDESLLVGCEHHRDASRIPLHEATRLLMNRCSGLLFSLERLQRREFTGVDADFVGRNLAKAQLAFGDVILTAHGKYHWSCIERHARLKELPMEGELEWARALVAHHEAGVAFKLHPSRSTQTREQLQAQHTALTTLGAKLWLWLERRRLHEPFPNLEAYATAPSNLCPETSSLRNRLINARAFGPGSLLGEEAARYPRERLFRTLGLLLFQPESSRRESVLGTVRRWLRTEATDLSGLVAAYGQLWGRFN